jgi:hypothetical protein
MSISYGIRFLKVKRKAVAEVSAINQQVNEGVKNILGLAALRDGVEGAEG